MSELQAYADAFEQTWAGVSSACTNLTPEQWHSPTDLPGWTVKDNVSHILGEEKFALGDPAPEHEVPDLPHLRHDFARLIEIPVDLRRPVPGDEVLREFREVTARRLAMLRSLPDSALDDEVPGPDGTWQRRRQLGVRVFDCWTHEQDIRRALGHPGGLATSAARISLERVLRSLPGLAEDVPAATGRSMAVTTTGAVASASTLRFDPDRSYVDGAAADADVRVTVDFATFLRIATGRVPYDAVAAEVAVEGDVALGEELLRHAAITP
ncbi:MAG TPA: maleylpyruvate isomerase family mycothiol-dependent enzyme [Mycobacteriales bacterium]|nr:maleylpyruvate isomerase family mycothiol-dependent enzyme [Mycobacteriales bacterium]